MILLLGSMGVPLTNGFIGEFILLKSIFDYDKVVVVFAN
jgi:NADH-quinone oxidoreductase subunit M